MIQGIKIEVLNIEDEEVQFQIYLGNGISSTSIDFFGYTDTFEAFANELVEFPKTIEHIVLYELGEVGERWAYYIFLKVFCYENNGYSAIQIKIDNNRKQPHTSKSEFYITTVPASLNKLGKLIQDWDLKASKEIVWIAE